MIDQPADLLITNGTVITNALDGAHVDAGTVVVAAGHIAAVGPADQMTAWQAAEVIDAGGGIVMPGLVNTHTHLPMSLFRGLADDLSLMTWLNDHIFPAESAHINPETVRLGVRLAVAEMLLSGTTTCCDGYFYEDAVAEAIVDTGIRAVLAQGVIDYPAPGVPDPKTNVAAAAAFADRWLGRHSRITPSIFCHSPYTCSRETLIAAKAAARDRSVLFQIHVAETKTERDQCLSLNGTTPIQYLDSLGILDSSTLLVHAVWVDEADRELIANRQAAVSHNPESNMKLGAGIAPVPALLDAGVTVGLGTDSCASNNDLDLFAEMDTAAKLHKVAHLDPVIMDAHTVLGMATVGGANAIGLGGQIGTLEPGKQADIVIVDSAKPHLTPVYHPESLLVYAARGSDVKDVFVGGRQLVKDGAMIGVDVPALLKEVRARCRLIV
jgi:5-methylthioadenosine/S-adenosylhomocysteine deaminase